MKNTVQALDCLIIGGGLIGATLALALQHKHMSVALVERAKVLPQPSDTEQHHVDDFDPRVSALTLDTQKFLSDLGVWSQLSDEMLGFYTHMHVWDECGTGNIQFEAESLGVSQLGCIVENRSLLLAIYREIVAADKITLCLGQSVKKIHNEASGLASQLPLLETPEGRRTRVELSDGRIFDTQLIVAADGGESRTRKQAAIPLVSWDYDHTAIVCTVKTELPHQNVARQRFSEMGPLAFLPLRDKKASGQFCSIVWSVDSEQAVALLKQDDATFMRSLKEAIEAQLGDVIALSKRASFPLKMRHAKRYYENNIVLVGDAAHTIHPLAGQGVNLGFGDVQALVRQVDYALKHKLELSESALLRKYQRERMGENVLMTSGMEAFKRLFGQSDPGIRWLRNTGLNWVDQVTPIKHAIAKKALGIQL